MNNDLGQFRDDLEKFIETIKRAFADENSTLIDELNRKFHGIHVTFSVILDLMIENGWTTSQDMQNRMLRASSQVDQIWEKMKQERSVNDS